MRYKHCVQESIWTSQIVTFHVIVFQCSKIHDLLGKGQGEEILFMNPPFTELGVPKTAHQAELLTPGSIDLGTEGVWDLQDEAAATSWL